jgi:hypothetical protein
MIPIDSCKDLKSILEVLLANGNVESNDLPKLFMEKRQMLGKSFFAPKATKKETIEKEQVIRASCSSLVLKLIAANILRPLSNLKNKSRPSIILQWGKRENNGGIELAYRSAIGWDSITETTCQENN